MAETKQKTGYPSVDRPWLKYYSEEAKNAPLPTCSLYEYLYHCNREHPDDIALLYFGGKISFRKLFFMIDRAAKAFSAIGVKEDEIVPIVAVSTVASVVCLYALNRIGAVADFLNVLSEPADLEKYFREAAARTVVTMDLFGEKVLAAAQACGVRQVVSFGADMGMPMVSRIGYGIRARQKHTAGKKPLPVLKWADFLKKADTQPEIQYRKNPHKMCLLAHTGGTTGEPKAVMLDDCAVNAVASQQYHIYKNLAEFEPNSVFLHILIPFAVYGISTCMHMPLCMGWGVGIIPSFDGAAWPRYLKRYHFSHVFAIPSYITSLINNKALQKTDLSFIRTIAVGGDGLTESFEKQANIFLKEHHCNSQLYKGYGMTEICAAGLISFPTCNRLGSVGIPLIHNNLMIYDNTLHRELGYHEVGEVCLQSPSRMINNEEETKALFRTHDDGSEWLHTGDLGYVDEDGFLFLVGRMKRIILTAKDGVTYKVFPNMTEKVLDENESVIYSCVVGAVSGANLVLKAYLAVSEENLPRKEEIEKELRALCERQLPSYARPTFYEFRKELPLTAAGKIDYRQLENEEGKKEKCKHN